jgi:phosphoglycolate phosphatase
MTAPALVLFDLDGTLVDSVHDLAAAADDTMRALGRAPPGEANVRTWVGNGIERLVHRCLTGDMHADAPAAEFDAAMSRFMHCYERRNGECSSVYAGAVQGLAAARAAGARLGCVTNKSHRFTAPLLSRLGLAHWFDVVVSGDTAARKKPHPDPLLHAAAALGVAPADTLLVGDSENDVRAARAAGMRVLCVSYGYNHGRDIRDACPDAVLDSLAELAGLLDGARPPV